MTKGRVASGTDPDPWIKIPSEDDPFFDRHANTSQSTSSYPMSKVKAPAKNIHSEPMPTASSEVTILERHPGVVDQTTRQHGFLYHVKPWTTELLFILLCTLVFIILIVVLAQFNNKTMPKWSSGLTLNTLAAVLATVCRVMTIVPVTEGISQLKWNWFATRNRSIRDLYLFDQASRGPWAFFLLISRTQGRYILFTTLAAMVLVSGLATSFLTQSAITYNDRMVQRWGEAVTVPAVRDFPGVMDPSTFNETLLEGLINSGIQAAFSSDPTWPSPSPKCPSGECQWPTFSSLAVCATMSNVTSHLELNETDTERTVFLPGDIAAFSVALPDKSPETLGTKLNFTCTEELQYSLKYPSFGSWNVSDLFDVAISQFFLVYQVNDGAPRAIEIVLHFCVDEYEVSVSQGNPKTSLLSSTVQLNNSGLDGIYNLKSRDESETFKVDRRDIYSIFLSEYFCAGMKGNVMLTSRLNSVFRAGIIQDSSSDEVEIRRWSNLQGYFSKIAASLTAHMRNMDKDHMILGTVFETKTFIDIRWEWLAFLAAQIGLATVFLVIVIIHTSKSNLKVVKSSNLAELFALNEEDKQDIGIGDKMDDQTMARLVNGNSSTTWKLKLS